ncbi:MAG: ABC transporter permease [Lachnospiraceae bacterium]
MKQSRMLLKLEIKRAMTKLPRILMGALLISLVVAAIVLFGAVSNKGTVEVKATRVALVTNNNKLVENVGMKMMGNMETVVNLFEFSIETEEEALKKFENMELEGIVIFPDNYIDNIGRGENDPARVLIRSAGFSYSVSMIAEIADAAGSLLGSTEAASYALQDWAKEYEISDSGSMVDEMDVTDARVILSREDIFNKVTIYGEDDVSFTQSYFCSALVILVLLWGLSCGTILKSDSLVLTKKLSANLISTEKQMLIKFVALVSLLGSVFVVIGALLLGGFAVAPQAFELIEIDSMWQIVLLLLSFIPVIILGAAIVMLAYTLASNQLGGILLLFIGIIVMSYVSGCLFPSVYLPETIRSIAKYLPTTYMHKEATNALAGMVDIRCILIMVFFSCACFVASVGIMKYKENKV